VEKAPREEGGRRGRRYDVKHEKEPEKDAFGRGGGKIAAETVEYEGEPVTIQGSRSSTPGITVFTLRGGNVGRRDGSESNPAIVWMNVTSDRGTDQGYK